MPLRNLPAAPATAADLLSALPRRQTIEFDGTRVSYRSAGSGPAIVFLHGLLGNADSWAWQFHTLSTRYRVIAWDAPGYADSSPAPQDLDAFAGRLHAFLEALGLEKPALVGNSMGGTVAARLASLTPASVGKLVLSCSHAGYGDPADAPPTDKLRDRIRTLREEGGDKYGRSRAPAMLASPANAFTLDLAARIAAQTRPEGLFDATRMLQFADLRPHYAKIAAPTLVIFGERDPVVRPEMSAELRQLTPFAEHVTIPDTGHAPYLEDPESFGEVIEAFLTSSGRPPLQTK